MSRLMNSSTLESWSGSWLV